MSKILFAGDFCAGYLTEDFDYEAAAETIGRTAAQITSKYDISVVNAETVFSDNGTPIKKDGGNIRSPHAALSLLKSMNFTVGACANNHFGDYGEIGVKETLAALEGIGLRTVGAGKNAAEAEKPLYLEVGGMKIALVNCAEHEYGIAEKNKAGAAGMDYYTTGNIVKAAAKEADRVIVYIHGGNEHNPLPRPGMKKFCRFLAESGADAVILSHSHCPQGIEVYKGTPIVYGMGNFWFPSPSLDEEELPMWQSGYMTVLSLEEDKTEVCEIIPYIQHKDGKSLELLSGEKKQSFEAYMSCISQLINSESYDDIALAWSVGYFNRLKGLIENTDTAPHSPHSLYIRNTYTCESHNEAFAAYYKAYCEGKTEGLEKYTELIKRLQHGEVCTPEDIL